jgi:hypothetical protein
MDGLRRGPTFLSLPAELRLQIYSHALPRPHQGEEYLRIRPTGNFFDYDYGAKCKITIRSVLRTCRAIHAEFSEFLYQCIKFNIIDNVAQDELWLKQYICVVRHLEIKVMSCYQLERCHLRPIFHTIAEGQQKNIGVHGKFRLNSLTINLEPVDRLRGEGERVFNPLHFGESGVRDCTGTLHRSRTTEA